MMRLATFNAGLASGVLPYVAERLPRVISALAGLDVDLLFVQEFWLDSHWRRLASELKGRLPYVIRPAPARAVTPCCSEQQLRPFKTCAEARCPGLRDEALARCVVQHCAAAALSLATECLDCIASAPEGTLEDVLRRCTAGAGAIDAAAWTSATGRAGRYRDFMAYGGSFGTGLLLRREPVETETITFASSLNARGALYARMNQAALGELAVFAAHLSPGGEEQGPQMTRLLQWIDQKAPSGPAILIGDLNTTPDSSLFAGLRRAGFRSGRGDPGGTYSSSSLESGHFADFGWRIDHVLLRGDDFSLHTQRILEQPVQLEVAGRLLSSTLSDHAGLLATIEQRSK